jgi:hypothetical protein
MNYHEAIIRAREILDNDVNSQAQFCLENALKYRDSGWFKEAKKWAIMSIEITINKEAQ